MLFNLNSYKLYVYVNQFTVLLLCAFRRSTLRRCAETKSWWKSWQHEHISLHPLSHHPTPPSPHTCDLPSPEWSHLTLPLLPHVEKSLWHPLPHPAPPCSDEGNRPCPLHQQHPARYSPEDKRNTFTPEKNNCFWWISTSQSGCGFCK